LLSKTQVTNTLNRSTCYKKHKVQWSDWRHLQHKWETADKYQIWR